MANKPEVSVVIPTRDRWPLLSAAALPAASRQEGVDLEIIVVDDGSADGTALRLGELDDPRVRVLRQARSRGVAQARNAGIAVARGEWIAFLDDDDVWAPTKLRTQLDAASVEGADFVYSEIVKLDQRRRVTEAPPAPDPRNLAAALLERNVMRGGCSNVIVRTETLRRVGLFDERLFQLADWDLWIRLASSEQPAVCREVLVGILDHSASMLVTSSSGLFREFDYLTRKHEAAARQRGVEFDREIFVRWVALGYVRAGRRRAAARLHVRLARDRRDPKGLARAATALLGERGVRIVRSAARRIRRGEGRERMPEPSWLAVYR